MLTSNWLQEKPSFRLPREAIPSHYDVKIQAQLSQNAPGMAFKGRVTIRVKALRDTVNVTLHSKELRIRHVRITPLPTTTKVGEKPIGIAASYSTPSVNDYLVITAEDTLKKGREYNLEITFEGSGGESIGFFRASDRVFATQFGPIHARRAFPCFDEPDLKAKFRITLTCDGRYKVITNMELETGRGTLLLDQFTLLLFSFFIRMTNWEFVSRLKRRSCITV